MHEVRFEKLTPLVTTMRHTSLCVSVNTWIVPHSFQHLLFVFNYKPGNKSVDKKKSLQKWNLGQMGGISLQTRGKLQVCIKV